MEKWVLKMSWNGRIVDARVRFGEKRRSTPWDEVLARLGASDQEVAKNLDLEFPGVYYSIFSQHSPERITEILKYAVEHGSNWVEAEYRTTRSVEDASQPTPTTGQVQTFNRKPSFWHDRRLNNKLRRDVD